MMESYPPPWSMMSLYTLSHTHTCTNTRTPACAPIAAVYLWLSSLPVHQVLGRLHWAAVWAGCTSETYVSSSIPPVIAGVSLIFAPRISRDSIFPPNPLITNPCSSALSSVKLFKRLQPLKNQSAEICMYLTCHYSSSLDVQSIQTLVGDRGHVTCCCLHSPPDLHHHLWPLFSTESHWQPVSVCFSFVIIAWKVLLMWGSCESSSEHPWADVRQTQRCFKIRSKLTDQNIEPRQALQAHMWHCQERTLHHTNAVVSQFSRHSSWFWKSKLLLSEEPPSTLRLHLCIHATLMFNPGLQTQNPVCKMKVCGRTLCSNTSDDCCGVLQLLHTLTSSCLLSFSLTPGVQTSSPVIAVRTMWWPAFTVRLFLWLSTCWINKCTWLIRVKFTLQKKISKIEPSAS